MQAPDNDPHTDGTGSALLAFCRWLHDQGFVSKPSGLQPALQCAPDPVAGDWQTPRCPPPRVDGLLSQFIKSCTRLQPIIVSQFRKTTRPSNGP